MATRGWGGSHLYRTRRGISSGGDCHRRARRPAASPATRRWGRRAPRVAMPPRPKSPGFLGGARYRLGADSRDRAGIVLGRRPRPVRSPPRRPRTRCRLGRNAAHRSRRSGARTSRRPSISPTEGHCPARVPACSRGDADELPHSRRRSGGLSGPLRRRASASLGIRARGPDHLLYDRLQRQATSWDPFPLQTLPDPVAESQDRPCGQSDSVIPAKR